MQALLGIGNELGNLGHDFYRRAAVAIEIRGLVASVEELSENRLLHGFFLGGTSQKIVGVFPTDLTITDKNNGSARETTIADEAGGITDSTIRALEALLEGDWVKILDQMKPVTASVLAVHSQHFRNIVGARIDVRPNPKRWTADFVNRGEQLLHLSTFGTEARGDWMVDDEQESLLEPEDRPNPDALEKVRWEFCVQSADIVADRATEVMDMGRVLAHPNDILSGALRMREM